MLSLVHGAVPMALDDSALLVSMQLEMTSQ